MLMMMEYVMLKGVNDSLRIAHELGKLLQGKKVLVNLIPYNNTSSSIEVDYDPTDTKDINSFKEKPAEWINAGFFVLEPSCIDYISDLTVTWEQEPLKKLAESGQLMSFYHEGFWQPMDTLRDKNYLESLWDLGEAPWKIW